MANYYTSQSIANYDDNPPPDDGTESEANRTKYATVKDELADPIKTLTEAIDAEIGNMEGRLFLNGSTTQSTTYTLQASDLGKVVLASNTITITALGAATSADGYIVCIKNAGTGVITLAPASGEQLDNETADETVALNPDDAVILRSNGTKNHLFWLPRSKPIRATAQATTSGTAFDFTDIPPWVTQITIMFETVSLSGTDNLLVQLGDAGGIETGSYVSTGNTYNQSSATTGSSATSGLVIEVGAGSAAFSGLMTLANVSGNIWISSHNGKINTTNVVSGGGNKTLSAILTQLRVTRTGTDTFDSGNLNIFYQ